MKRACLLLLLSITPRLVAAAEAAWYLGHWNDAPGAPLFPVIVPDLRCTDDGCAPAWDANKIGLPSLSALPRVWKTLPGPPSSLYRESAVNFFDESGCYTTPAIVSRWLDLSPTARDIHEPRLAAVDITRAEAAPLTQSAQALPSTVFKELRQKVEAELQAYIARDRLKGTLDPISARDLKTVLLAGSPSGDALYLVTYWHDEPSLHYGEQGSDYLYRSWGYGYLQVSGGEGHWTSRDFSVAEADQMKAGNWARAAACIDVLGRRYGVCAISGYESAGYEMVWPVSAVSLKWIEFGGEGC